jgi:molecular chaperone HtpG
MNANQSISYLKSMEKKKSVFAVTNEKVSTYISDDLSFSILSKLPLKSFKRFQCVRKSWSLLYENHHFMSIFRSDFLSNSPRCSYYNGSSIILMDFKHNKDVFYSFTGERFENKVKLDLSNPFKENLDVEILGFGSISGILCLHRHYYDNSDNKQIALWNPVTQTIKCLPPSEIELAGLSIPADHTDISSIYVMTLLHGFGYDHAINDYKVIRYIEVMIELSGRCELEDYISVGFSGTNIGPSWEIYSLRSDSWREIPVDMPYSSDRIEGTQVYMDGVYHWLCQNNYGYEYGYWKKHNIPFQPSLVTFYLSNEVFCITPIPSDVDDSFDVETNWRNLAVLNGTIALISYYEKTTTFHISIMGEIGVKESWTNLFTIGPLPCVECPIGVGTKGEIFFIRNDEELAWFDLSTQMIEQLGYKAQSFRCRIINYKEIILPIEE